jgi:hypothetical protein
MMLVHIDQPDVATLVHNALLRNFDGKPGFSAVAGE